MSKSTAGGRGDVLLLIAGNAAQYLTAIVSVRLMTSILSPSEMGRFAMVMAIVLWFNVLVNGAGSYVQRNLLAWDSEGLAGKYVLRFAGYLLLVSLAGTAAVLALKSAVGLGFEIGSLWIAVLVVGLTFFVYLNNGFIGWLNLFRRRLWYVFFSNVSIWAGLGFSFFFTLSRTRSAENWLLGQVVGQAVVLLFTTIALFKLLAPASERAPAPPRERESLRFIFNFAWPMSVSALLMWLQQSSYRFILEGLTSVEVVGLVAVGLGLGSNFMNRFEILFNQFYHPVFFKEISTEDPARKAEAWNAYAYFLMPAAFILALYIISGGPFLARVFVAEQFYGVTRTMLGWGVISQLILILMTIYSMAGIIQQKTTDFILPNVAGVVVMAAGLFLLLGWNPYSGTGIALCAGSLASLLVMRVKMKKLLPVRFPLRRVVFSLVLSAPMVLGLVAYALTHPAPGLIESLVVLAVTGAYMTFAELLLVGRRLGLPESFSFIYAVEEKLETFLPAFVRGS